ncbi:MAG: hypothetical protein QXZ68_04035 [Candidatus Bathyarchaeia archaeon]
MKFKLKLGRGGEKQEEVWDTFWEETELAGVLETQKWSVPEGYVEVEYYPLKPPSPTRL